MTKRGHRAADTRPTEDVQRHRGSVPRREDHRWVVPLRVLQGYEKHLVGARWNLLATPFDRDYY